MAQQQLTIHLLLGEIKLKKIAIIGAGGFGKEVAFLLERTGKWEIIGFFDDGGLTDEVYGYKVLGGTDLLENYDSELAVVCAVGNSLARGKIISKIKGNPLLEFPNIVDPSVIYGKGVQLGQGNIICAGTILTVDIILGDFNIINLSSTIGHDVRMGSFNTIYPSVNVSGFIETGNYVEIGTGTQIIQNLTIGENTIVGAGSVVIRDIPENTVSVGAPSKVIKQREKLS